ncbi:hypothetical protein L202_07851 [Cryptococcus amylolentus CBS 6039]|uniref:Uncharacterized protein n=1 Tax=Cryptococcus amylolentus CBS 6039 TaxID=1295533 RepID=A0A1E3HAH4_9TREE|nr:hypothetical protein L202_07851 [Cryptococcus amylolentus CBS 6039]ODN73304.1 hypothetical protein L202_07851 [Cryptococcus amylolentus CBS 6039]
MTANPTLPFVCTPLDHQARPQLPFRWAFRFPTHARWEKTPLPRKGQELDLVGKVVDRREDGVFVLEPFNVVFTTRSAPNRTPPSSADKRAAKRQKLVAPQGASASSFDPNDGDNLLAGRRCFQ